jgi:hypothetical protein
MRRSFVSASTAATHYGHFGAVIFSALTVRVGAPAPALDVPVTST